jgi:hypothetical protein
VLLKNNSLTPNRLLRSQIKEWQHQQQHQQQQLQQPQQQPPPQHPRQPQQRHGGARGGESANASSKTTVVKLAEAAAASSPSAVASLPAAASAASAAVAAPRSAPSAPAKRIFVEWKKHKPEPAPAITSAQLFHHFLPFGAVEEEKTFVVFDRGAQSRQPFGFVEFRGAESAARAVAAKTIQIGAVAANASFAKAAR